MITKKEFELEKEIIKLKTEKIDHKHEIHMKELEFIRKTELFKHECEKERMRIKSAEIRKNMERKIHLEELRKSGG